MFQNHDFSFASSETGKSVLFPVCTLFDFMDVIRRSTGDRISENEAREIIVSVASQRATTTRRKLLFGSGHESQNHASTNSAETVLGGRSCVSRGYRFLITDKLPLLLNGSIVLYLLSRSAAVPVRSPTTSELSAFTTALTREIPGKTTPSITGRGESN